MESFDPDEMNDDELAETLRTMQEDMTALEATLQDFDIDPQMAQQAIAQEVSQRSGEEMSEEEAQAEIIDELAQAADRDEDTIRAIAAGEIDTVPDEVVDAMATVLDVDLEDLGSDLPDEDDGESADEGGEEEEAMMSDLEEVKQVVGQVAGHLSDISDMLQAKDAEHEQEIDDLERRLSELEEEPVSRSLTGQQDPPDFVDTDDSADGESYTGSDRPML